MTNNVLQLEPRRRREVPTLRCAELRLSEDCRILELTLFDEGGTVEILEYALVSSPDFGLLDRLRRAWDGWRGDPPAAVS